MSVTMQWYDAGHSTLHMLFSNQWSLEAFKQALEEGFALAKEVDWEVYVIAEFTDALVMPPRFMMYIHEIPSKVPANHRKSIVVGGGSLVTAVHNIFKTILPNMTNKIVFAESVEAAYDLIVRDQQRKPPLSD